MEEEVVEVEGVVGGGGGAHLEVGDATCSAISTAEIALNFSPVGISR